MSLRILFADDSVTAQNMGKKILSEAGYEVVAVSNGAAAVKKIAEQKPDIIILDVYMPGYSGLEVCEKVRGSVETMKTPVLLTVGKMEPYKPEDANRVKADGVIVKPFEASDLLAIMKKFEERVGGAPARAPQPILVERTQEEIEPPQELPVEQPIASAAPQPTVEVPDHMATTSAFSDLLGAEPPASANHYEPAPPPAVHEVPASAKAHAAIPDYELPVSWRERLELDADPPVPAAKTALVPPAAAREPEPLPPPATFRPLRIPVYQENETARNAFELVPTSAPPTGEIEIPREPELQETAAEATRNTVAEATEPGLLPSGQQFAPKPASAAAAAEMAPVEERFTPAGFQDIPADIASHLPSPVTEIAPRANPAVEPFSDAEFEARVAAAMSSYDHAHHAPPPSRQPPVPGFAAPSPNVDELPSLASRAPQEAREIHVQQTSPATQLPAAAQPYHPAAHIFEYRPPVQAGPKAPTSEVTQVAPAATQPEPISAVEPPQSAPPGAQTIPRNDDHESLAADLAAAMPAVTAAGLGSGADHNTIAQAVHRVVERLKPELVEEILRELKSKKE